METYNYVNIYRNNPYANNILSFCWILFIGVYTVAKWVPWLDRLSLYGKSQGKGKFGMLEYGSVSNGMFFQCLYGMNSVIALGMVMLKPGGWSLLGVLWMGHLVRRFWESVFVARFSGQRIRLLLVLSGFAFYFLMSCSIWFNESQQWEYVSMVLWGLGCFNQWRCHVILAKLRKEKKKSYAIPQDGWFEYVWSPHYFFECLIYVSFVLISGGNRNILLALVFVIENLSFRSVETRNWYYATFSNCPEKKTMIPFVW